MTTNTNSTSLSLLALNAWVYNDEGVVKVHGKQSFGFRGLPSGKDAKGNTLYNKDITESIEWTAYSNCVRVYEADEPVDLEFDIAALLTKKVYEEALKAPLNDKNERISKAWSEVRLVDGWVMKFAVKYFEDSGRFGIFAKFYRNQELQLPDYLPKGLVMPKR